MNTAYNMDYLKEETEMKQSPHNRWYIRWKIFKWNNSEDEEFGKDADEVFETKENIILIGGVREMLKLISGIGGKPYDAENTRIYVGESAYCENFHQQGVLAIGEHRACAKMDDGFPFIDEDGTTLYYQATFGENDANFRWNEVSIANGDFENCIALNRKVESMGPKTRGTWTIRVAISINDGEILD